MAERSKSKPRRKRTENLDLQRMRRLYSALAQCSRATRDRIARNRLGTEVPALLDLRRGDLVVTSQITPAIRLLGAGQVPIRGATPTASLSSLSVQLGVAAGLALRARDERSKALVTLFVDGTDRASWRECFELAAAHKLPILFFLFSRSDSMEQLVADAQTAGIASMVVDASDAVAVYRICQEAHVRTRMGDGPAFIAAHLPRASARPDALRSLAEFLRDHKYPVDAWKATPLRPSTGRRKNTKQSIPRGLPFHVIGIRR